jgi:hypothetical protein
VRTWFCLGEFGKQGTENLGGGLFDRQIENEADEEGDDE